MSLLNVKRMHVITEYANRTFQKLISFDTDSNDVYYVSETDANRVLVYDNNWIFQSFKTGVIGPRNLKVIGNNLAISAYNTLQTTDNSLNILSQTTLGCSYGTDYSRKRNVIMVANHCAMQLQFFNMTLSIQSYVPLTYQPFSLLNYNETLYIGTWTNQIIIVNDDNVTNIIQGPCINATTTISSIYCDQYGYCLISCFTDKTIFLFNSKNRVFTGYKLTTIGYPYSVRIDSRGRLIVTTFDPSQIEIYY